MSEIYGERVTNLFVLSYLVLNLDCLSDALTQVPHLVSAWVAYLEEVAHDYVYHAR